MLQINANFCLFFFSSLQFNFVGRILGPRGMTAKQLEQETGCKIMVRGKGSMRDKKKVSWVHGIEIACDQTCFKVHSKYVRADCNRQSHITICNSFDLDISVGNFSFDLFSALNFMELWLDYLWWAVLRAKLNKISHPFSWSSKALSLQINQCEIYLKQRPLDILSVSAKYRRKNVWKSVSFDVCGIAFNISTSKCIKRNATKTRMTKNMMWSNESAVSHEAAWNSSNTTVLCQ